MSGKKIPDQTTIIFWDSMTARRIQSLNRSGVSTVDLDEIARRDWLFSFKIRQVLMVINVVVCSVIAIVSFHVHWLVVGLCAVVAIALLFSLPKSARKLRELRRDRKSVASRAET